MAQKRNRSKMTKSKNAHQNKKKHIMRKNGITYQSKYFLNDSF